MRAEDIRSHLRKQPFQAFRIHMSDGVAYEVRHPEMVVVSRSEVVIATEIRDELPDRMMYCDPVHITRIERMNGR